MLHTVIMLMTLLSAQAHGGHRSVPSRQDLSPKARALLQTFEAQISPAKSAYAALTISATVPTQLRVRATLDQAMREFWPDGMAAKLSDADRDALDTVVADEVRVVDDANTGYLREHLPSDGWFHRNRDGEQVTSDAWLIAQHSSDMRFQSTVAARMAPLVESGEVLGSHFALIYDRTEMFAGRPQVYGSQVACKDGRWQPFQIREPASVDVRRHQFGMVPLADYMKNFTGPC